MTAYFAQLHNGLIHRMQQGDTALKQKMISIGIPEEHLYDLEYIQRLLRTKMVEEWQQNLDNYQGYLHQDLSIVSQQYLQDGHFAGDAGDLMVLTLANVLGLPITIFTSIHNMPVLCVMPTSQTITTAEPVFLAFSQNGPGHYDAAVSFQEIESTKEVTKCNCGRKANFEGQACSSKRCKCFRMNEKCQYSCRCKSCMNTYGIRPPPSASRKQRSYEEQERQPLRGRITEDFMSSKSETIEKGSITLLENLLLKGIVMYLIAHGLAITSKTVLKMFKIIHYISMHCQYIDFPIFDRTESCIKKFLHKILHVLELFNYHNLQLNIAVEH